MRNFTVLLLISVIVHFAHLPRSLGIYLLTAFQYLRCARHVLHPCSGTRLVLRAHYLLSLAATHYGSLVSLVPRATLVRITYQFVQPLLFVVNDRPLLLILGDHGRWGRALEVRGSLLGLLLFVLDLAGDVVLLMHIFDMILRLLNLHIFKII